MKRYQNRCLPLLATGLGAGLLNGLLGAGGGILIVYALRGIFSKKVANGRAFYPTALAVMLPLSALSAWQYAKGGHLLDASVLPLVFPALAGGLVGAMLLSRMAPRVLNRIFAAVVLISGILLAV
ncbi:MAG: hypothetical protein E7663_03420 [Ruminococcaceae bacterium]|nr:hypothetical protein [Oscillospiraceae bacterium]